MSEKYIQESKGTYRIVRNSRVYGKFTSLEDAIFVRDLLEGKNWNLDNFTLEMHLSLDRYVVVRKIDGKLHLLGKFDTKPNDSEVDKLTKRIIRNPNNSKYGLNISRVFEIFMVKKQIAGDSYIFGFYDKLEDATFVRNYLLDNSWNVNAFPEIAFDDETATYKISQVIDDKVWVIGSYDSHETACENVENSKTEFLTKIYKHKFGLANHPHLDSLKDDISDVEKILGVEASDRNWNFENVDEGQNPGDVALSQIVFNLTPWQKIIYDGVDDTFTFDEIKNSLKRYESKNFDAKISKYLDELIELGLVEKLDGDCYRKV